jgi:hypothetical protein
LQAGQQLHVALRTGIVVHHFRALGPNFT